MCGDFLFLNNLNVVFRKSGISPTSAPTKWQSIQRIGTGTDTETSVHVGEHLWKQFTVLSFSNPPNYVCQFATDCQTILSLTLPAVDHSRVKLENTENDYINASLVVMEEAQRSYILTQASLMFFIPVTTVMTIIFGLMD